MQIRILKSKIHRATVTEANLDYEGSLTIDLDLIERAGLCAFEKIAVWNVTNGNRFETYVLEGARASGVICVNGAAAHLAGKGDLLIIAAYGFIEIASGTDVPPVTPRVVRVDAANRALADTSPERAS